MSSAGSARSGWAPLRYVVVFGGHGGARGFGPAGAGRPGGPGSTGLPGGSGTGPAGGSARGGFGPPRSGSFPGGNPGGGLGGSTTVSSALTKLLAHNSGSYTWAAATIGSESAAPLQLATGLPVMSIGGFNGTDPAPSLAAFERLVADHKIHYFVGENGASFGGGSGVAQAISKWVSAHFRSQTAGGVTVYNLTQPR
jgi:hypothetical protein